MHLDDIPIDSLSFKAYRLPDDAGQRQSPSVFLNLAQWFEAEKFRAFAREQFQEVMHMPSAKEARRLAARHRAHWRGDWLAVGYRALACGMVYASRCDHASTSRWSGDAESIASAMKPLGLPERLVLSASKEFVRLRLGSRVAFLGGGAAPFEVVGKRINAIHRKADGAWLLTHWQGRHSSWAIHDWALQQHVPVTYFGEVDERLRPSAFDVFKAACDQVVVFEKRQGRLMDGAIKSLRSIKVPVDLELYSPASNLDWAA